MVLFYGVVLTALIIAAQVFSSSCELALLVARGNPVAVGGGLDVCAVFSSNTSHWSGVQSMREPSDFYPAYYPADTPTGCDDVPMGSWEGRAVLVDRGGCPFYRKGRVAEDANASLLVVVLNESTVDFAPSVVGNSSNSPPLSIPVLLVSSDGKALEALSANLSLSVYIPSRPPLDPCTVLIFLIAVGTVFLGAFFANAPFEFMKYGLLHRKGDAVSASDSAAQQEGNKKAVMVVSMVMILVALCSIVGLLLLLYFFYYPMVYVVISLYCIGATVGLYSLLAPFVGLIPFGSQLRVPENRLNFRPDVWYFILVPVCTGFVLWWVLERHAQYAWVLQDLLGFAFITYILKRLFVLKPWVVAVLMCLLFFYDIFMVFITPFFTNNGVSIMEQAALGPSYGAGGDQGYGGNTTLIEQIPVVFKVPRMLYPTKFDTLCDLSNSFSILGYGDVGIPGLLVCVCLKFDLSQRKCFKMYYAVSVLAYATGLVVTFIALAFMQSAQPALLYLVPTTLGSVTVLSLVRKEFVLFFTGKPHKSKAMATSLQQGGVEAGSEEETDNPDTENEDTKTLIKNG